MTGARRNAAAIAAPILLCACALALVVVLPGSAAHADRAAALQGQVAAQQAQERSLAAGMAADAAGIRAYAGPIARVQARLDAVQSRLSAEQAQVASLRSREAAERIRLARVEAQMQAADQALARNLVSSYEGDQPDALSVIFSAHGFSDLIERVDFLNRVKQENAKVVSDDRRARIQVSAEAERLGALEAQDQKVSVVMLRQRNQVDGLRIALVSRQLVFVQARNRKGGQLAAVSAERRRLEASLAALQAQQAAAQQTAQPRSVAAPSAGGAPLSAPSSGGGFVFPLPTSSAVGPGSWSEDQGVDIAAPGDTPEYAVGSGTIVLHGIGGFGPWAPVLHLDSPIDGQSYVYYGHAGPANQLAIGTHVSAGEVMSSIGPGIVGLSSGPHLEIGFADASGTPAPGTSATMMSLLQGSYH